MKWQPAYWIKIEIKRAIGVQASAFTHLRLKSGMKAVFFLLLVTNISFGQTGNIKTMIDSLQYMRSDTLDCSASLYWRIVAQGDKAIPDLINSLTDTTPTNISYKCKQTKLNVGEVSYFALREIASVPIFLVTKIQFDLVDNGCWNFYEYLFHPANKIHFQTSVEEWFQKSKRKYKRKNISKKNLTECQIKYGIKIYYHY